MRKIVHVLFHAMMLFLIVSFASCNRNDVKKVELDNSFAVALFSDTIEFKELLNTMDPMVSEWIKVDQNGDMYAFYADSVIDAVTGEKMLSGIADLTFDVSSEIEVPNVPASPVPVPLDLTFDDLLAIPFAIEGYSINSVILRSGRLSFELMTDLPVVEAIELKTENIKLADGSNLTINIDVKNNDTDVNVNLKQCKIIPKNNEIKFSASVSSVISDEAIGGDYNVSLKGGIIDLKFESIDGSIEDIRFDFFNANDISFGINNISGDFKISKPIIDIEYINTFGFEASCNVDSLYFTTTDANSISLIKDWDPLEMTLQPTETYESVSNFSKQIVNEISLLENYNQFRLCGNIIMACDEIEDDMITYDSHIDVVANVRMPMEFSMNELRYSDTIDFNLSISDENTDMFILDNPFDELEFKFIIENGLPLQIKPNLYMAENGVIIDSIFEGGSYINGCFDGTTVEDVLLISIGDKKIENLLISNQLILDLRFSTKGNIAMMNIEDYIKVRIGLKTKTTELSF